MNKLPIIKNSGILILAFILAWGLFSLTRDDLVLTASVLDIAEQEYIKSQQRDVAYKIHNQTFELFGTSSAQQGESLIFTVLYNPDTVQPQIPQEDNFQAQSLGSWEFQITLGELSRFDSENGWFELPFTGAERDILLGEAKLSKNNQLLPLRVGNLTSMSGHAL